MSSPRRRARSFPTLTHSIQREVRGIDVRRAAAGRPPRGDAERLLVRLVWQAAVAVGTHERRARGHVTRAERVPELMHAHRARGVKR